MIENKESNAIPKLYTVNQVAEILGVLPGSVYRYIRRGQLKVKKLGRTVRISEEELQDFIGKDKKKMTGYGVMADACNKFAERGTLTPEEAEKKKKTLLFLSACDTEDIYNLFNSGAFNDITIAYARKAANNVNGMSTEQKTELIDNIRALFSVLSAEEICSL